LLVWTDRHLHLGSTTTSRGEGNHFVAKRYIKIVNGDLLMVLKSINLMLETQFTELNAAMEAEKCNVSHRHRLNFMKPLVGKISKYALDKFYELYQNRFK